MKKKLSCYVIGGDTLLIECVKILVSLDFDVVGIISSNPSIKSSAAPLEIKSIDIDEDLFSKLSKTPFDYLFSITHLEVIDSAILKLPERDSINFHDGPLPNYAGLNCPVWALMNGVDEYGITWHKISAGIDKGDILYQEIFNVSADESALSLNTKCFAAALSSFPKLLAELKTGQNIPYKQNLTHRHYYSKFRRPESAAVVDWSKSAIEIEMGIRALSFGDYENPIGCATLMANGNFVVIESANVQDSGVNHTKNVAGQIQSLSDAEISVETGDGVLTITSMKTLSGADLSIKDFARNCSLSHGDNLPLLLPEDKEKLTALNHKLCKSEAFWTERLSTLQPAELPITWQNKTKSENTDYQSLQVNLENCGVQKSAIQFEQIVCAYLILIARITDQDKFDIFFSEAARRSEMSGYEKLISNSVIFRTQFHSSQNFNMIVKSIQSELDRIRAHIGWINHLEMRQPSIRSGLKSGSAAQMPLGVVTETENNPFIRTSDYVCTLIVADDGSNARIDFDAQKIDLKSMHYFRNLLEKVCDSVSSNPLQSIQDINLLSDIEHNDILINWNQTDIPFPSEQCIHEIFEQQVLKTPHSTALVFQGSELTYFELNERSNMLANELVESGVGPGVLVGVCVDRSLDVMISTLGILKAGGAYVPLDPAFPENRIEYMIQDACLQYIVTQRKLAPKISSSSAHLFIVDLSINSNSTQTPETGVCPTDLAYVIYTSGSTGQPKGVMVEHRNVVNFFTGMDNRITYDADSTWMAVTSLSFDISVLELFWTLCRGLKVVIYLDPDRTSDNATAIPREIANRSMGFGLFMWGNDDAPGPQKYRLMLEGAKFFDEHKFDSVWTPERHFHAFGGPFPNPAVTGAALAATTKNLSIRAGSCVSPLHHPIRIAEDWAIIDNLSNGRVGLSFASGWQPNDFVIKPENHKNNKTIMLEQIELVRKLWRGEKVEFENPFGEKVEIVSLPRPVQSELPVWVTTAGNPETYIQAGTLGANILTHLLGQSLDELSEKIKLYRDAREKAGFDPETGIVSLMLHTFIGSDYEAVKKTAREPMKNYLRSSLKLAIDFAWSFPAFKCPGGAKTAVADVDIKSLSESEVDAILEFAFERYFENSGLFGKPENCVEMVNLCKKADVNEIACLLDYGIDTDRVLQSLPFLKQVKEMTNAPSNDKQEFTFSEQIEEHKVSHLQCTPSMARMLQTNPETKDAFGNIEQLLIGGEPLPISLVKNLTAQSHKSITNMYGPTETTIWSTTQRIRAADQLVSIGKPIANTKTYILNKHMGLTPIGVPGELYIGGAGISRGYLNQPDLTARKFVRNPFSKQADDRIYRTGDQVFFREDGSIEFLGRVDNQVKIRGYRIELGEIESQLEKFPGLLESVVSLLEKNPEDQRLVAYYVSQDGNLIDPLSLKNMLRSLLPDYMIPGEYILLNSLPMTPNGKVDRNALPYPVQSSTITNQEQILPKSDLETKIADIWQQTLKITNIGVHDNFFDLGGHSLLIVQMHAELLQAVNESITIMDLYRFPTIHSLAINIQTGGSLDKIIKGSERAQRRREMKRRHKSPN